MSGNARVLVVGAGLSGLAAALAAARAGASVDLVGGESVRPIGQVQVNVPPNMLRDLVTLGVAGECVRAGFPYLGTSQVDARGIEHVHTAAQRLAGLAYPAALAMTHAALSAVLLDAARHAGATVHLGVRCDGIEETGEAALARFEDGSCRPYDLVVAADGADSRLRQQLFGTAWAPQPTGQVSLQVLLRRPPALDGPVVAGLKGCRVVAIPVSNERASLIFIHPEGQGGGVPAPARAALIRDRLKACGGLVAAMRDLLSGDESILARRVRAGVLPGPWHRGRVLLIGEAAHVIPPHLGQAAAQCIEDATVLGALLGEAGTAEALFSGFMRRRYERCRLVHDASLQVARWEMQPDSAADIRATAQRQLLALAEPA